MVVVTWLISDGSVQPTRAEWDRFQRYASWMRRLDLDSRLPEEVLRLISTNSPNGILFPGLQVLFWVFQPHALPFYRLFLSPHLTDFSLYYSPPYGGRSPDEVLSGIASVIVELNALPLQSFSLDCSPRVRTSRSLESAVSSAILRWGPSLTTLSVSLQLSDATILHIMRLPNLTTWYLMNGPPRVSDLKSLCDDFPRLKLLGLQSEVSLQWLPLFEATARRISSRHDTCTPSNRELGQELTTLTARPAVSIDATFISPIMRFHRLTRLALRSSCSHTTGCTFSLTDDDAEAIATALPHLRDVAFGHLCSANSCQTTVSSLVSFSTHCENLARLQIHFNTTNLRGALDSISANPRLDNFPSFPEGGYFILSLRDAPISINKEDAGPVVRGFSRIFPRLKGFEGGAVVKELDNWLINGE